MPRLFGKLQFASVVAPGMQVLQGPLYDALQAFENPPAAGRECHDDVEARVGEGALNALRRMTTLMSNPVSLRSKRYPHANPQLAGSGKGKWMNNTTFWTCLPTLHGAFRFTLGMPLGIKAVRGMAVDDMGIIQHPRTIGNSAQLFEDWRHGVNCGEVKRLLHRSDNSTAVAVVNPKGTVNTKLRISSSTLVHRCRYYQVDLASMHIPGASNG